MALLLRNILLFLLIMLPAALSAAGANPGDAAVLAAYRAYLAHDRAALTRAAEKTRGHLLDLYVRNWMLRLRLNDATAEEINDFLNTNRGGAVAEQLRQDWLHRLGEKGRWELFNQQFPLLLNADSDNRCYALQERLLREGLSDQTAAGVNRFWEEPRPLPEGCIPVVSAMVASGRIASPQVRFRVRMLLFENRVVEARRARELYSGDDLPAANRIEDAFRKPEALLGSDNAALRTTDGMELSFIALASLARTDLAQAANLLDGRFKTIIPPSDQQVLWAHFAMRGARRHLPESTAWFARGAHAKISGDELAWRVRIALRDENWPEVASAIDSMTEAKRNESSWTYWRGRALSQTGGKERARELFEKIAGRHDFYGILAAEELGLPLQMPAQTAPSTKEELACVSGRPGIQRALALYRLNLRTEAAREWRWCVRSMSDRQILAAAELARLNGIWDRSVWTAEMTSAEHSFALRYPNPYKEILQRYAASRRLDEAIVAGLVRQESMFIANARSSAGATGLMQLMPATARLVAKKIGLTNFHHSRLTKPEINAALGTSYLRQILDKFSQNYAFAAASYNAGPHRAAKWRHTRPLEGAIYVESIPFTETRRYVKKVLANAVYYAAVSNGEHRSLKGMLGRITTADNSSAADAAEE